MALNFNMLPDEDSLLGYAMQGDVNIHPLFMAGYGAGGWGKKRFEEGKQRRKNRKALREHDKRRDEIFRIWEQDNLKKTGTFTPAREAEGFNLLDPKERLKSRIHHLKKGSPEWEAALKELRKIDPGHVRLHYPNSILTDNALSYF